jgi:hypothetical protein
MRAAATALAPESDAEALIARRLRALGHAPDYLSPQAIAALLAHAAGSPEPLRVALAAVLFLAATEDAPRVDAALVARALNTNRVEPAGPAPVGSGRAHWLLPAAFGVGVTGLMLALAILATRPPPEAAPVATIAVIAQAPLRLPPREVSPRLRPPPPTMVPAPPALAPLPPAITIRELPVPQAVPATPSVLLLFPAHSPRALARLRTVARALQRAGITDIRAQPIATEITRQAVSFFHPDDSTLAQLVATTIASAHWPHLEHDALAPSLVVQPARPAGEIEVALP